ncbi:MAG: hypothetical protein WC792_03745 [Candidatus Micrarchaeia archaeon]|jgi:chromosome segregation ATPase
MDGDQPNVEQHEEQPAASPASETQGPRLETQNPAPAPQDTHGLEQKISGLQTQISQLQYDCESALKSAAEASALKKETQERLNAFGEIVSSLQLEYDKHAGLSDAERSLENKLRDDVRTELKIASKNAAESVQKSSEALDSIKITIYQLRDELGRTSRIANAAQDGLEAAKADLRASNEKLATTLSAQFATLEQRFSSLDNAVLGIKEDYGRTSRTLNIMREDAEKALGQLAQMQEAEPVKHREIQERLEAELQAGFKQLGEGIGVRMAKIEDANSAIQESISSLKAQQSQITQQLRADADKALAQIAEDRQNAQAQHAELRQKLEAELEAAAKALAEGTSTKTVELEQKISALKTQQEQTDTELKADCDKAISLIESHEQYDKQQNAQMQESLRAELQAGIKQVAESAGEKFSKAQGEIASLQQSHADLGQSVSQFKNSQEQALQQMRDDSQKAIGILSQEQAAERQKREEANAALGEELKTGFKQFAEGAGTKIDGLEQKLSQQSREEDEKHAQISQAVRNEMQAGFKQLADGLGEQASKQADSLAKQEEKISLLRADVDRSLTLLEQEQQAEQRVHSQVKQELEEEFKAGFKELAEGTAQKLSAQDGKSAQLQAGLEKSLAMLAQETQSQKEQSEKASKALERELKSGFSQFAEGAGGRLAALEEQVSALGEKHAGLSQEVSGAKAGQERSIQQLCTDVDKALALLSQEQTLEQQKHSQLREKMEDELKTGFKELADGVGQKIAAQQDFVAKQTEALAKQDEAIARQQEKISTISAFGAQIAGLQNVTAQTASQIQALQSELQQLRATPQPEISAPAATPELENKISALGGRLDGLENTLSQMEKELDEAATALFEKEREKEAAFHTQIRGEFQKISGLGQRLANLEERVSKISSAGGVPAEGGETERMLEKLSSHVVGVEEQFRKIQERSKEFELRSAQSEEEVGMLEEKLYAQFVKESGETRKVIAELQEQVRLLGEKNAELERKIAGGAADAAKNAEQAQ